MEFDELLRMHQDAERQRRFDLWAPSAQVTATLVNIHRDKKTKAAKFTDFIPKDILEDPRSQASNSPNRINTKDQDALQSIEEQAKALKIFASSKDLE